MMRRDYELDDTISKVTQDITLWQTEKGIIEIGKNTLAIPIRWTDRRRGYVFRGHGKLLLDTIVETEEGAIGKPVDRELNDSFLMLGNTEEIQKHLAEAREEDFTGMGYENRQGFVAEAEDLCNQFFRGRVHGCQRFDGNHGLIFAFQNEEDKLDMLVTEGSKLVYKATDLTFVSKENKQVLKTSREVVCKSDGRSVIIQKNRSVLIQK